MLNGEESELVFQNITNPVKVRQLLKTYSTKQLQLENRGHDEKIKELLTDLCNLFPTVKVVLKNLNSSQTYYFVYLRRYIYLISIYNMEPTVETCFRLHRFM